MAQRGSELPGRLGTRRRRGQRLDARIAKRLAPRRQPGADFRIEVGLDPGQQHGRIVRVIRHGERLQRRDIATADRLEAEAAFQAHQALAQGGARPFAVGLGPEQGGQAGARRRALERQPGQQQRILRFEMDRAVVAERAARRALQEE